MALPKIDVPTYDITLPVSKKTLRYRPFLVKEQRNLLMAMESSDSGSVHSAIRDILYNCTLTEGVDIEKLPIVDVEYYFINLRAKSVGEVVDSKYRCNNTVTGKDGELKECNNLMDSELNLLDVKVEMNEDISSEIQITDTLILKMKYPEFSIVKDSVNITNDTDIAFNMLAQSVEYIYDGDQFYYGNETPVEEMVEFLEMLSQEQFSKIEEFFNNQPKLKSKVEMTCTKCGFHHIIPVEGLESFFG
jgi:hypothetical protein